MDLYFTLGWIMKGTNASANGDHIYEYLFTFTDGKSDPITLSATWEILNGNDNRATLNTTTFTILENQCAVIGEAISENAVTDLDGDFPNSANDLDWAIQKVTLVMDLG